MIRTEKVVEAIAKPLNTYDFLGYVAPGGTLLLSMYLFERWCRDIQGPALETSKLHTPIWTMTRVLRPSSTDWVLQVLYLVALLAVCYVVGHIVASVSSLAIDRTFIGKGYGYPMFAFLGLSHATSRRTAVAGSYYRGLFFWLNLYLLLRYWALFIEGPQRLLPVTSLSHSCAPVVGWLILVSIPVKIIASAQYAGEGTLRRRLSASKVGQRMVKASCRLIDAWCWLYDHVAETLFRYLFTREPADDEFKKVYFEKFENRFGLDPKRASTNNFWLSYMNLVDGSPELAGIAANWLRLYAFARNLSAAFYMFFVYGFVWLVFHSSSIKDWEEYRVGVLLAIPLGSLALSLILLTRFYYLYASYYTRFIFRSFVFLATRPERGADCPEAAGG